MEKTIWTHGCDACDSDDYVRYVPPLGYLCESCRQPKSLDELWREHREMWAYDRKEGA